MGRSKKGLDINGWLVVDKPRDMTSNMVVMITRRLLKANKNGHTGTLDPFATGVLPIAFGEATKLIPFVTDGQKEYEFTIVWGKTTNTDDSEGEVFDVCEKIPNKQEILEILPKFLGKIQQVPSSFSAIKINGQRAYNLARQGVDFEMPSREIEIYALELLDELPNNQAKFRVLCSKGTYVRTLGKDMAIALGSLGYLQELRRTKCGIFSLNEKILLEDLENMMYKEEVLLPMQASLRDIAVLAVNKTDAMKLAQGQSVSPSSYDIRHLLGKNVVAVCDDKLVAIIEVDTRKICSTRVFNL